MPDDPRNHDHLPDASELPILIGPGKHGEPEELLLVARPRHDGTVPIVRWTSGDWSATPERVDRRADDLLAELERAARGGRGVNQEMYLVRRWLSPPAEPER